jgi:hypothetical protein
MPSGNCGEAKTIRRGMRAICAMTQKRSSSPRWNAVVRINSAAKLNSMAREVEVPGIATTAARGYKASRSKLSEYHARAVSWEVPRSAF